MEKILKIIKNNVVDAELDAKNASVEFSCASDKGGASVILALKKLIGEENIKKIDGDRRDFEIYLKSKASSEYLAALVAKVKKTPSVKIKSEIVGTLQPVSNYDWDWNGIVQGGIGVLGNIFGGKTQRAQAQSQAQIAQAQAQAQIAQAQAQATAQSKKTLYIGITAGTVLLIAILFVFLKKK